MPGMVILAGGGTLPIAHVFGPYGEECGADTVGNARLIAAAPDLLKACKMMADWIDGLPRGVQKKHLPQLSDPSSIGLLWIFELLDRAEGR